MTYTLYNIGLTYLLSTSRRRYLLAIFSIGRPNLSQNLRLIKPIAKVPISIIIRALVRIDVFISPYTRTSALKSSYLLKIILSLFISRVLRLDAFLANRY